MSDALSESSVPVVDSVVFELVDVENSLEHVAHLLVIGACLKVERSNVLEVVDELGRVPVQQFILHDGALHLADELVVLAEACRPQTRPGQPAAEKVGEDVPDGLEVVTARLLLAHVRVHAHVTRRADELIRLTRTHVTALLVKERLRQAVVDHVHQVRLASNHEVFCKKRKQLENASRFDKYNLA